MMPCAVVSERIEVILDATERLETYSLYKQSCGMREEEPAILQECLTGCSPDEILALDPNDALEKCSSPSPLEKSLITRHLSSIQSALRVYMGREAGGPDDPCLAASIAFEGEFIRIEGHLATGDKTEPSACGHCRKNAPDEFT